MGLQRNAMQCNAMRRTANVCGGVRRSAEECGRCACEEVGGMWTSGVAMQCNATQSNAMQRSAMSKRCNAMQQSAVQRNAMQRICVAMQRKRRNAMQCSVIPVCDAMLSHDPDARTPTRTELSPHFRKTHARRRAEVSPCAASACGPRRQC